MNIKLYFKQSWQLMQQNRFFSVIYIVGSGLAISMIMVLAVTYHIRTANIAPEVNRSRSAYLESVSYMYNERGTLNAMCGPRLAAELAQNLETPEAVAFFTNQFFNLISSDFYLRAQAHENVPKVNLKACNSGFWEVFRFHFLEGKPFSEADVYNARRQIVINETTARTIFSRNDVVGERVFLNGVPYVICGVVADVSPISLDAFGDVWVPYTSMSLVMNRNQQEDTAAASELNLVFLLNSTDDFATLQAEVERYVQSYNRTLRDGHVELRQGIHLYQFKLLNMSEENTYIYLWTVLFLFFLIPALNISGLNSSEMQQRKEEIGVRLAFGAPRTTVFWQIFVENLVLMLPSGVIGLLLSYLWVYLLRNILLVGDSIVLTMGLDVWLSPAALLDWKIFLIAFLACLLLNLLSAIIPVWHAVHKNIIWSLNKSEK